MSASSVRIASRPLMISNRSSDSKNGCRTPLIRSSDLELLRRELVVVVAVDDLDRFLDAARRLGTPHLGVAARADALGQRVAGQHDVAGLECRST